MNNFVIGNDYNDLFKLQLLKYQTSLTVGCYEILPVGMFKILPPFFFSPSMVAILASSKDYTG